MAKTQVQQVTQTTSNIGPSQLPYYNQLMQGAQSLLGTQVPIYGPARIEGFTPQQKALQQQVAGMQTPGQFGTGTDLATAAGIGALRAAQYTPGQFNAQMIGQPNLQQYSMGMPGAVQAQQYGTPQMQAAQTGYAPSLNYFQMEGPQQFGTTQAQQYMSPFVQAALEPQMREAVTSAKRAQLAEDLGAARQGTYGGSRQLLASMERERNLQQQMGDIYGRGMQTAFESAQQQFERDRAARMQAQQANLQAQLGVQQLSTDVGMRTALANLDAASQANVQNLAAQLQTQGLNADQALRAALANQQAELTTGQQNLAAALETQRLGATTGLEALRANQQADLEAMRMGEQSRQFGAQQGLAGLAQAAQAGQTLANIGQVQSQTDLSRLGFQQSTAAQEQALRQQMRDLDYQDFLYERDYPYMQYQRYANLLSAVPQAGVSTSTQTAPAPSLAQQIMGAGLGALGTYNMLRG